MTAIRYLLVMVALATVTAGCGSHAAKSTTPSVVRPSMEGISIGATERAATYTLGHGRDQVCFNTSCRNYSGDYDHGRVHMTIKDGRVVSLYCAAPGPMAGHGCPNRLDVPGRVRLGSRIPFTHHWRGYRRYTPPEPQSDFFYWKHPLASFRMVVYLVTERGRVVTVGLESPAIRAG